MGCTVLKFGSQVKEAAAVETSPAAVGSSARVVGPIAPAPKLQQPKRTRRPAMLALMVLTVVAGAIGAILLVQNSAKRTEVVGLAHDVAWGQMIQVKDLVDVAVVPDPSLLTVKWADRASVAGQFAATDLLAGSLVSARSVTGAQVPGKGQALVGLLVKSGQLPATALHPQDRVLLVLIASGTAVGTTPSGAAGSSGGALSGEVFTVGAVDANGSRTVDVLVPLATATSIAQAAAEQRVSVILVPKG